VAISTAGSSPAQVDLIRGLNPNGRFVVIASDHQPIQFSTDLLVFNRRVVAGWYSGHARDSEETYGFRRAQRHTSDSGEAARSLASRAFLGGTTDKGASSTLSGVVWLVNRSPPKRPS